MKITCPVCSTPIPVAQLNVEKDLAVCSQCQEAFAISTLLAGGQVDEAFNLNDAPRGAWFSEGFSGWTIGATTRSAAAFFLVPFTCVWAGGSLGGIYGTQLLKGEFNPLFSLFGLPFLAGSVALGMLTLMCLAGKTTVTVEGDEGRLFSGIGPFGWTRRFLWSEIVRVTELERHSNNSNGHMMLALEGSTRLTFGSMLNEPRRYFLLQGLRTLLARRVR